MFARIRTLWRALRHRNRWEGELDEELRWHVEQRAADLMRRGLAPEDARRRARVELGSAESYKEQCRASTGLRFHDELWQDLRYAARVLRRSPGFTAVAMLSLALGIGANTVVFSVINSLLLKPLPVAAPEELYFIQGSRNPSNSFPNYRDLRDRNSTMAGILAYRIAPMAIETAAGPQRVWGYLATGNYFEVLGVRPAVGRFFTPAEDRDVNGSPYAVLSYACWQGRFGGDPRIAGRTVRINSLPYTVLGVAPREFHGTERFYWPEAWVPMTMQPQIEGHSWLENRATFNAEMIGRLRAGVTRQQAEANLGAIMAALVKEYPRINDGIRLRLTRPGFVGDALGGPVQAFTGGVMVLAALVLLAACANLASLLSARAADRDRELGIRQSIGAGRGRILRQLLTESVLLAALGGAGGWALANVLLRLLSQWHAPLEFPIQFDVTPDARVLLFAAAMSLATGVLFGIAPARQAWKADPNRALKGGAGTEGRRWAGRDLLLAAQVALCCVLVTSCLVAFRGLSRALSTPLGFQPRGVVVAGFDLSLARYSESAGRVFQQRALAAAARLPGVTAAAVGNSVPLSIDQSGNTVYPDGTTEFKLSQGKPVTHYEISPGYFRALGTRLVAGRDFDSHDDAKAPEVAIVNEALARALTGTANAAGRRFLAGPGRPIQIVGVVEDGKYTTLTEPPRGALFRPIAQEYNSTTVLVVRTSLPQGQAEAELRQSIAALDAGLPLYGVGSMEQMLGFVFFPSRAAAIALSAFGLLAVMLAITGIYGMATYAVSRRVREIGIRIAVGARPGQVLRCVFGRIAVVLLAGSGAGLALGAAAGQVLASIVYQASARDPLVLVAVPLAMAVIGLGAGLGPARRVLSVDPLQALRSE
jgi:macrolide transport system ATP-binding/permease protein